MIYNTIANRIFLTRNESDKIWTKYSLAYRALQMAAVSAKRCCLNLEKRETQYYEYSKRRDEQLRLCN